MKGIINNFTESLTVRESLKSARKQSPKTLWCILKKANMIKFGIVILTFFFLISCASEKKMDILYLYIYNDNSANSKPIDSFAVIDSSFEKSLSFYKDFDSISKNIPQIVYFSIFTIHQDKFAILIDTTTKVYKLINDKFEKQFDIPCEISSSAIRLEKLDINSDGETDILLKISSDGAAGDIFICLFYNPEKGNLEYDNKTELRNIVLNLSKREVKSFYNWSSANFKIEKSSFKKIEEEKYLMYSTTDFKYENYKEVTTFDKDGKIITVDTLEIEKSTTH